MKLRTGKTIASGLITPTPPKFDPMAELKKITPSKRITVDNAQNMYKEQTPNTSLAILTGLARSAITASKIVDRMRKISIIYDIILADKTLRNNESYGSFIHTVCSEASKHMTSINTDEIQSLLVTNELIAVKEHFHCILEKFIDRTFGLPADYNKYSYHYDIMKKIGYEAAALKKADIFNYAHAVDYDEDLIGDYIRNEVTVYELYAMVTYNTNEALPNSVSYEYCFNEALSWYKRPTRE